MSGGPLLQRPAQGDHLAQGRRNAAADRGDELDHECAAAGAVGFAVGGDHPLVDAPGGFDLDVVVGGEQRLQALVLCAGEEVGAGVQGAPGPVQRVVGAAAVTVDGLLDAAPAAVQGVAGEADDMERVHHRCRVGEFLGGGGLEPGEPVHRDDLHGVTPGLRPAGEPGLERLLRPALDHVQQPGRAGTVADAGEVDDHGDELVPAPGVPPGVLVDADRGDAVEPVWVVDEEALALGQNGIVGGVPRHAETLGDAGDREVLNHQRFQRPPQTPARQPGSRFGRPAGVLAPHMTAAGAPVAADRDQQRGRSPAQRFVRQPPQDTVARHPFAPAAAAPLVRFGNPAGQHSVIRFEALAGDDESELIESAEGGQISAAEAAGGSVEHVEVFRMSV
jgi:hypothetical protein